MSSKYASKKYKKRLVKRIGVWIKEMELTGFVPQLFLGDDYYQGQTIFLMHTPEDRRAVKVWLSRSQNRKGRWLVTAHVWGPVYKATVRQEAFYSRLDDALLSVKTWLLTEELSTRGLAHACKKRNW